MRIQYVSYQYFPVVGGSEFSLQDLLRFALENGHEVQVLVQDQQRRIFSYEAVPIQEIPGWESVRDGILRFRPDIILTHLNWQQIAIEQARQLHIPVIH